YFLTLLRFLCFHRSRRSLGSRLVLRDALRLRNLSRRRRIPPLDRRHYLASLRRRRCQRQPVGGGREVQILFEVVAHRGGLTAARRDNKSGGAYQNKPGIRAHKVLLPTPDRNARPHSRAYGPAMLSAHGATGAPVRFPSGNVLRAVRLSPPSDTE